MIKSILKNSYRSSKKLVLTKKPLTITPDFDSKQFLFIAGLHRSGTSILHRLLKEHPEISGFSGTAAMEDEGQHLQSVFSPAHRYGGPGKFAFNLEAHLTENAENASQQHRDQLLREWGAYFDLEKNIFLEKSPPNIIRSRYFQSMFPNAKFVFIIRHPISVALATEKWAKTNMMELLFHWHVSHTIMLQDLAHIKDYIIIRYEDLVRYPEKYLEDVCNLIELDNFHPQKEKLADHNKKYFQIWQQNHENNKELFASFFETKDSPMNKFAYSFSEPYTKQN